MTEEQKSKISNTEKGKKILQETKEKLSKNIKKYYEIKGMIRTMKKEEITLKNTKAEILEALNEALEREKVINKTKSNPEKEEKERKVKQAKGYYGAKHYRFRNANQAVLKSLAYAYVGRKDRKYRNKYNRNGE